MQGFIYVYVFISGARCPSFNLVMSLGGEATSAAAASHTYLAVLFCFKVVINFSKGVHARRERRSPRAFSW